MALIKSVATSFGIDATYWNIYSIEANAPQCSAQVILAGYLNHDARQANHRPLAFLVLKLSGPDYPGMADGIAYMTVYNSIKEQANTGVETTIILQGACDGRFKINFKIQS